MEDSIYSIESVRLILDDIYLHSFIIDERINGFVSYFIVHKYIIVSYCMEDSIYSIESVRLILDDIYLHSFIIDERINGFVSRFIVCLIHTHSKLGSEIEIQFTINSIFN